MRAAHFAAMASSTSSTCPRHAGRGQLLIKVAANGVCGSDRKILQGFNLIPGHEVAGTVVEAGPGCQTRPGTRIAAYIPIHCGECPFCLQGKGNLCPNMKGLLGWATDGGYAEYMLVRICALRWRTGSLSPGRRAARYGTSSHALRLSAAGTPRASGHRRGAGGHRRRSLKALWCA